MCILGFASHTTTTLQKKDSRHIISSFLAFSKTPFELDPPSMIMSHLSCPLIQQP